MNKSTSNLIAKTPDYEESIKKWFYIRFGEEYPEEYISG